MSSESDNIISRGDFYTVAEYDYFSSSSIVGFSSYTQQFLRIKEVGKSVTAQFYIVGNADGVSVTFTVPSACKNITGNYTVNPCRITDNSASAFGYTQIGADSTTVHCYPDATGSNWTASGTRAIHGVLLYEKA